MKKIITILALCIAVISSSAAFAEEQGITVSINGEKLETPIAVQIVNDRTMLPMRSIFEALGASVTWSEKNQIIFATKDADFIALKIGSPQLILQTTQSDESKIIELDAAPFISEDYTLVPVRAVAEALKARVDWEAETKTVKITNR